ncbi:hypothetical protein [Promicromonospora sukumoe]|uniref:hypothetical protein n=1 Tax=Promicromonospora sukumoe TaxID=88382 RepID=UPI000376BAF8|nr:hypothetical protein [Promicromonospora sukumoe]
MSPETVARSVRRLTAAGVGWPTTRRVAITVRLAGLADVIALGDAVVEGPTAARDAVGHVLRTAGREADPAAALREIARIHRVLAVLDRLGPEPATGRAAGQPTQQPTQPAGTPARVDTPDRAGAVAVDRPTGPRPLPVRQVGRPDPAAGPADPAGAPGEGPA